MTKRERKRDTKQMRYLTNKLKLNAATAAGQK